MQFVPKTEKELAEENLFPAGVYPFEIIEAADKTSKSGNEMIELKLRVFHGQRTTFINDYLLEAFGFKLRHASVTLGLESQYDAGEIHAEDFKGRSGWAKVGIQKDKTGNYPDRNSVLDYVAEPKEEAAAANGPSVPKGKSAVSDDDIPFTPNVL